MTITATQPAIVIEPLTDERATMAVSIGQGDGAARAWEIVIIGPATPADLVTVNGQEAVRSKNGRCYTVTALREAAALFNGARVYDDHLTDREFADRGGLRSVAKEWLGSIAEARFDEAAKALMGKLHMVDDGFAIKLARAAEGGVLDSIGLSIDVMQRGSMRNLNGEQVQLVEQITKVNSVDAVGEPAAGGRFVRALESIQSESRSMEMDEVLKQVEQLMAAIDASMLPDATKAALKAELEKVKSGAEMPEGEAPEAEAVEAKVQEAKAAVKTIASVVQRSLEALKPAPAPQPDPVAEARKILDEAKAESQRIIEAARTAEAQRALESALNASGLPDQARAIVRSQFANGGDPEAVKRAIEAQRSLIASLFDRSGNVTAHARQSISVGRVTEADRFALGFLRLMAGATRFDALINDINMKDKSGRPVFKALQEAGQLRAIESWVADGKPALPRPKKLSEWYYDLSDDDFMGIGQFGRRALEANLTTSTLASIVKNTVNLLLAANYSVRQQWWQDIVFEEDVDTIDDATLVRVFGISTLPVVNEGAAYTELTMADEEETAAFFKRGGYVGVTLETFLKDKLNQLREIPTKLANAWYNTISSRVAAVFTVNTAAGPVLADSGALFNATAATSAGGHANLLTTALDYTAFAAVDTAMKKQTDQPLGAGERLGAENAPTHLLVPIDLAQAALRIRNSQNIPGSANNDINPYYQRFEVVEVPTWTDATNWATVAKPGGMSPIHLIYLRGRRTPELFTADQETTGAMFTNDEMRFKVRQFAAEFSSTYACAPVADWRSLHKSNVAG